MRNRLLLSMAFLVSVTATAAGDTWKVDPVHSSVFFRIQHVGAGYVRGAFTDFQGSITWNPPEPEGASVAVTVKTASVNTFNDMRDKHLRSPDFFNVKEYPEMTFRSASVKKVDEKSAEVNGELTLLGHTEPVTFRAVFTGEGKGMEGETRAGFEAVFTILRSTFGMTEYPPPVLSDEVELTINLECVKKEAATS